MGIRVIGLVLVVLAGCAAAPEESQRATIEQEGVQRIPGGVRVRAWEHESSDVTVDPRIRFGHLDNGLRWAWAANPEPQDRCYLRLHVDVGSLAEQADELGMAHFLEHMAFNGSENFESGTLTAWFQENGMAWGADTNAHTNFSETVYKLDLPESDAGSLREGLLVLRDFADRMLLTAEDVDEEKGVIDGEQRERDSAGFRVFEKRLELMFAGTRVAERMPIGEQDVRAAFTDRSVRDFYERWYRPDNMTLVAVGDLGELDPVPLFEELFGDMPAPTTPLLEEPAIGRARSFSHAFAIHEEEIPSVTVTIERLRPWEEEPDTLAERLENLPLFYARSMLNLRYHELGKKEGAPFLSASVSDAALLQVFDGDSLIFTCTPDRWHEALAVCEQELRRALEFGFQEAELEEVRADVLRSLDEAVEREPTAHSRGLLTRILSAAENRFVPVDAETRRAIYAPALSTLTVEACHEALREAWSQGELSIYATGNLDLGPDQERAGRELRAAYGASRATPIEAGETIEVGEFAYASDPARAGQIASRERVEDLDFEQILFSNGVRLDVKRTDFKENEVRVTAHFGEGRLTLDPEDSVLEWVGGRVFNGGGLEAHSDDDLRRLMAGKQVGVAFGISEDEFALVGATTAEDLLLQCELTCAYLSAPGWREDGIVEFRRRLPVIFEGLEHRHQGPVSKEFFPALFSGDPRYGLPEESVAAAVSIADIKGWLSPHLAAAPIEVSIVGDIDVEETIAIVARTFGNLPPRRAWRSYDEHRVVPAPKGGLMQEHAIDTQVPKSLVMIAYPTCDGVEDDRRRRMNVLNTVVNDRLRLEVRERLGAAYSPGSGLQLSETYPGVGLLFIQAMSDPDKVDTLVEACLAVGDSLATDGVTDEEADRLREPILAQRRDAKRMNAYWMRVLSRSQRDPAHLDKVRTADAFYEGFTAADITPLAREYLSRENASMIVVKPEGESN